MGRQNECALEALREGGDGAEEVRFRCRTALTVGPGFRSVGRWA
jgi:hypothetical protein